MNDIKVSIIVPVYNVEKYLKRCLVSLVNQTLKEIEIIIVDDGSNDNSAKIIDEFQKLYPNKIVALHTENFGVSTARNSALKIANGEYIGFVDADDFVRTDMFELLYLKGNSEKSDIVSSAYTVFFDKTSKIMHLDDMELYSKSAYESKDIFTAEVSYLWNKIFSRSMIQKNQLSFEKFKIFEDMLFVDKALLCANKISKVNEPLYFYKATRQGSATTMFSEKMFNLFDALTILIDFCKEKNIFNDFYEQLLFVALNHSFIRHKTVIENDEDKINLKIDFLKTSFSYLDSNFPNWKNSDYYYKFRQGEKEKFTNINYWIDYIKNVAITKDVAPVIEESKSEKQAPTDLELGVQFKNEKPPLFQSRCILFNLTLPHINDTEVLPLIKEFSKGKSVVFAVTEQNVTEVQNAVEKNNIVAKFVKKGSFDYCTALKNAKQIITDSSLPAYFIKKGSQSLIYLFDFDANKPFSKTAFDLKYSLKKSVLDCDFVLFKNEEIKLDVEKSSNILPFISNKILPCFASDFSLKSCKYIKKYPLDAQKEITLVFGGNLYNNAHTDNLFSALIESKENYVLTAFSKYVLPNYPNILSLPKNVSFYGLYGSLMYISSAEKDKFDRLTKEGFFKNKKQIEKIYLSEFKRMFGSLNIKKIICFGGKSPQLVSVLSFAQCEKILYLPSQNVFSEELSSTFYKNFDSILCKNKQIKSLITASGNTNIKIISNTNEIFK